MYVTMVLPKIKLARKVLSPLMEGAGSNIKLHVLYIYSTKIILKAIHKQLNNKPGVTSFYRK